MIYVFTTFLSAFLLFMIQPLMGKFILPWFGGAPAVWTTCMLFFQLTLLAGYTYAHFLGSRFKPRTQAWVHVSLLVLSLGIMALAFSRWGSPILPGDDWKPTGAEAPVPHILGLLLASIGLPYLLLSATSPLLQRWFSLHGHGEKTYRLYAVSNAGSLLGLLSYPFLTERFLVLPTQALVWTIAFALFSVGCLVTALTMRKITLHEVPSDQTASDERPRPFTIFIWLLLAMSSSAMLLAVTNSLCQEIATVPFLWVLPLALYLLSFIIAFDKPQWYRRRIFVLVAAILSIAVLITNFRGIQLGIPTQILTFNTFLFFFCLTCHGELVLLKPAVRHITLFYLLIALGGALGGLFVGLLAPLIFTSYWEFNIMVTLAWVVLAVVFVRDKSSLFYRGDRWHYHLLTAFLLFLAFRITLFALYSIAPPPSWLYSPIIAAIICLALTAFLAWLLRRRTFPSSKYWPRILVGTVIFLAECFMITRIRTTAIDTIAADRNFFGTLRVQLQPADPKVHPPYIRLTHGQINHGLQYQHDVLRYLPVSYYGPNSGLELTYRLHPRRNAAQPLRIGALGLGTGTVAAFAQPGDLTRFYEINPTVIKYAEGPTAFFTYIRDSKGSTETILGDARLSLESELREDGPQLFDVLVMDAFSSDSIPAHLLTQEAFELYAQHLRNDDSVIAVNISNRFLNLHDLMATLAKENGFECRFVDQPEFSLQQTPSKWALFTRNPSLFEHEDTTHLFLSHSPTKHILWTDSFSNLFHLLK